MKRLGQGGPGVSVLGFGCAGTAGTYGPADRSESLATVVAALDAGMTLVDTADFYGMGRSELMLAEVLRTRPREDVVLSVKFGAQRDPRGAFLGHDLSPAAAKTALAYTLTRLGTDYVDVYRPSRPDHVVPIEETIGAIGDLVDAGYVRHIALSEAGPETIRRAHAERPLCDVQLEYSLLSRGIEEAILPVCRELGIGVTAYGVLSRGLLSGHWSPDRSFGRGDLRANLPRFQEGNVERNLELVERLRPIAEARGATVAQLAIAWVASRGDDIVALVGGRRPDQVAEAAAAGTLALTADDLAAIEAAVPAGAASGERYGPQQMASLDSERGS